MVVEVDEEDSAAAVALEAVVDSVEVAVAVAADSVVDEVADSAEVAVAAVADSAEAEEASVVSRDVSDPILNSRIAFTNLVTK